MRRIYFPHIPSQNGVVERKKTCLWKQDWLCLLDRVCLFPIGIMPSKLQSI